MEKTLKIARDLCDETKFMTVQEMGRVFVYYGGTYVQFATLKADAALHRLISAHNDTLSPPKREHVIRNIHMITAVPASEVNPEGIFCFKDGVYDIKTGNYGQHSPDYKTTIQLPYEFKSSVDCPLWKKFIGEVCENDPEKSLVLQEFAGYCLSQSCHLEKALFLIGTGANGKSVFTDTLTKVFGRQNVSNVSLEHLSNPVTRCNILDKYINIDSDLPRNAEKFEDTFRKTVSGEGLLFNPKFLEAVTIQPTCKLIYCLNEFPVIDDTSDAFYRRMLIIPFDVTFSDDKKDLDLKAKLEYELAGIFRWCVEGYKRVIKNGFSKTKFMEYEINEIKIDNNPIMALFESDIEIGDASRGIIKSGLYKYYVQWTKDHGHKPMSMRKFNSRLFRLFRKHTQKDQKFTTGDREHFWPNLKYVKLEASNNVEYGERIIQFSEE
jgi:putative DNA primase/helicase